MLRKIVEIKILVNKLYSKFYLHFIYRIKFYKTKLINRKMNLLKPSVVSITTICLALFV